MISIVSTLQTTEESAQFDSYTPIHIGFGWHTPGLDPYYRWHSLADESLLEVAIHSRTRAIVEVNLIYVSFACLKRVEPIRPTQTVQGLPQCDVDYWDHGRRIEPGDNRLLWRESVAFDFKLGQSAFEIGLRNYSPVTFYQNSRIVFGADTEGQLCSISMFDVDSREISELMKALP